MACCLLLTHVTVAPPLFFLFVFFGALPEPKHHGETTLAVRAFDMTDPPLPTAPALSPPANTFRKDISSSSLPVGGVREFPHFWPRLRPAHGPSPSRESSTDLLRLERRPPTPRFTGPHLPSPPAPAPPFHPFVQEETSSVSEVLLTVSEPGQSALLDKATQESAGTCGGSR